MKKHIFAALILVAAICGCSKDNAGKDPEYQFTERQWIELTKSQQDIVNRGNGFAFDLFAAINKAEADKEVFISPFSMEAALCMLSNGAKGDTYSQIVNAMGYKGLSKEEVNSTYGLLTTALLNADNSTKFSIANALGWAANSRFSSLSPTPFPNTTEPVWRISISPPPRRWKPSIPGPTRARTE